jgi:hypothetical protein
LRVETTADLAFGRLLAAARRILETIAAPPRPGRLTAGGGQASVGASQRARKSCGE